MTRSFLISVAHPRTHRRNFLGEMSEPGSRGKQRQTRGSRRWFLQTFQPNQAGMVLSLLRPPHSPITPWTIYELLRYFLPNPPPCPGLDILPSEISFSPPEMRYVVVRSRVRSKHFPTTGVSHNSSQNSNKKLVRKLRNAPVFAVGPPWHFAENTTIHDHQRLLRTDRIFGRQEVRLGAKSH